MTLTHIAGTKNQPLMRRDGEAAIDRKATEVRARFATPGMDGVYVQKRDEAIRYLADLAALPEGEVPDLAGYPYLSMETGTTAPTPADLAALWVERNQQFQIAGAFVEAIRIAAKAEVRTARSQAQVDLVVAGAVAQLDEIGTKPPARPSKPAVNPPPLL